MKVPDHLIIGGQMIAYCYIDKRTKPRPFVKLTRFYLTTPDELNQLSAWLLKAAAWVKANP